MVSNIDYKPMIDTVSSVVVDKGAVYVSTHSSRPGVGNTLIPYLSPVPWILMVPEQGDMVEVYQLEDGSYAARACHSTPQGNYSMPNLSQREFIIKPDSGTEIKVSGDGAGNYNVDINASGDVNVNGTTVNLGDPTNTQTFVKDITLNSDGTVSSVTYTTTAEAE